MTIAEECMSLISRKLAKEISSEEFYCEVMQLHNKYPHVGFKQAAELYAEGLRKNKQQEKPDRKSQAAGDYQEEVPF